MLDIICCDCGDHPRLDCREVPLGSKNSLTTTTTTAMTWAAVEYLPAAR